MGSSKSEWFGDIRYLRWTWSALRISYIVDDDRIIASGALSKVYKPNFVAYHFYQYPILSLNSGQLLKFISVNKSVLKSQKSMTKKLHKYLFSYPFKRIHKSLTCDLDSQHYKVQLENITITVGIYYDKLQFAIKLIKTKISILQP